MNSLADLKCRSRMVSGMARVQALGHVLQWGDWDPWVYGREPRGGDNRGGVRGLQHDLSEATSWPCGAGPIPSPVCTLFPQDGTSKHLWEMSHRSQHSVTWYEEDGHGLTFPRKVPGKGISGQSGRFEDRPATCWNFSCSSKVYKSIIVLSCQAKVGEPISSFLSLAPGSLHLAYKVALKKQFLHVTRSMDTMATRLVAVSFARWRGWPWQKGSPQQAFTGLALSLPRGEHWVDLIWVGRDIRENYSTERAAELQRR